MIGMILVTHGKLAEHFIDAMEHVVGKQEAVATICIGPNDDMEQRRADIADAIKAVDDGQGAIILTDLFGGTPSNLAISLLDTGHIEVIAGISIGRLIPAITSTRPVSSNEIARLDGVPPNRSVRMIAPWPWSTVRMASAISARRCSISSLGPIQIVATPSCLPTTCSIASMKWSARRPWVTRIMPIMQLQFRLRCPKLYLRGA